MRLDGVLATLNSLTDLNEEVRRDKVGIDVIRHFVDVHDELDELDSVLFGHLLVEHVVQDEIDEA